MLRRPKVVLIAAVAGLGLILLALVPSRLNDQLKRLIGFVYLPFAGAADGAEQLARRSRALTPRTLLLEEIDQLRRENRRCRLQSFQTEQALRENARLRALVQWKSRQAWNLRFARVIVEDPANWWRSIHLDAGAKQGVSVDDPVLTDQGLVGKVVSVSKNRSLVALLGAPNCRAAAVILQSKSQGTIAASPRGGIIDRQIVALEHLPNDAPLEAGLEVETSGAGDIFPEGIPIGRLIDGQSSEFDLYSRARVRLWVDLDRLKEVWVIVDNHGEEREERL